MCRTQIGHKLEPLPLHLQYHVVCISMHTLAPDCALIGHILHRLFHFIWLRTHVKCQLWSACNWSINWFTICHSEFFQYTLYVCFWFNLSSFFMTFLSISIPKKDWTGIDLPFQNQHLKNSYIFGPIILYHCKLSGNHWRRMQQLQWEVAFCRYTHLNRLYLHINQHISCSSSSTLNQHSSLSSWWLFESVNGHVYN